MSELAKIDLSNSYAGYVHNVVVERGVGDIERDVGSRDIPGP